MTDVRTALVVVVDEVRPVLDDVRRRFGAAPRSRMPPHVTVLFPFLAAADIDGEVRAELSALFRSVPAFDVSFAETGWFGDEVLWLRPAVPEPFVALTRQVWAAFPTRPPYEGRFDDVRPHLTVAEKAPRPDLRAAQRLVGRVLPILATVREVTLFIEHSDAGWTPDARFALGGTD